jgi:hypothetical protein
MLGYYIGMETIMQFLRRRLKEVGPQSRDAIADETEVPRSLLRKIAYGDRETVQVATIQPVLDMFVAVDRGERDYPE